MEPWNSLYAACLNTLTDLGNSISDDEAGRIVPATPEWTVQQVFAHLAGGPADIVNGVTETCRICLVDRQARRRTGRHADPAVVG